MDAMLCWIILSFISYFSSFITFADGNVFEGSRVQCYDEKGRPQRCIPEFENAAFGLEAEATNTCGQNGPIEYCVLSSTQSLTYGCNWCNTSLEHGPLYMTDFSSTNSTWWQSETMYEGIQAPNQVNITLHFGKSFDITYIQLLFKSPRPHSFTIFKKTTEDGPWIPYQYYSASCRSMYGLPDGNFIRKGSVETQAFCTSEFSDLSPLNDGSVPFALLEGRPSAPEFDSRPEFWEWVTATDIRITLDRLNTFGDDIWKSPIVLKSYFYAIADFSVGARCKCNGHASRCPKQTSPAGLLHRTCQCEHFTAGPDCNECLPLYNDAPWGRATAEDAHECKKCNCNGFTERCFFDKDLYALTGHGGHCLECRGNRDGPNCERCRLNYYQPAGESVCFPCNCNETGSWNLQCNDEGKCYCKPGVTGDKCDRCDSNFYDFGASGCKECGCNVAGSFENRASCDTNTGICWCKENVEGRQCSSCKPGFFNLDDSNEFGCTPCFCYGHSSVCHSAPGYAKVIIENSFVKSSEKWKAELKDGRKAILNHNALLQSLEATTPYGENIYFVASDRFLGDQRASYNHDLSFKLKINDVSPIPSVEDVILEGAGLSISQTIFGQGNRLPSPNGQEYKFRLHENPDFGWQPRLMARDYMSLLSNLTAIKIRATYTPQGIGYLDEVTLETARRGAAGLPAAWIEMCTCPEGYVGQFCETCAPGSRHEPISGGAFAPCVPCNCNSHAKICDADTGRCICEHNTAGANCDRCARGYYGNALQGTPYDCKPCPCPNRGACILIGDDETVVCLECPAGYAGPRCEVCSDGYYGDSDGVTGSITSCRLCDCNLNVDPNAIGNCNRTTGECLKCIHNTGGFHCEQCLPGYYGDALAPKKGDCKPCLCNPLGTFELENGETNCDQLTGQCKCKPYVTGTNCDECEPGFFDISSGQGCSSCNCDPTGSLNRTCHSVTGQCHCRPGVTGLRCDKCLIYHYGFSLEGCVACECDNIGSKSPQCDNKGQCPCLDNVEGRRCDRCKENKYDRQRDCIDCPPCYNLVKEAVDSHRTNLRTLQQLISNISSVDSVSLDTDFEDKLKKVHDRINGLMEQVQNSASGANDGKVTSVKLNELYKKLSDISNTSKEIQNLTIAAKNVINDADVNVTAAEQIIEQGKKILTNAAEYLYTDGEAALLKAIRKSNEVGEQNVQMSQIARDARASVQKQEDEAEKIKSLADNALNISSEAYNKALEAINKQRNISDDLKKLNSTLIFAGEKLNETINQVKEARDQVSVAYNESLSIYRDVYALNIPTIDLNAIKESSANFMKKADENQKRLETVLTANKNLLMDINDQLSTAEKLLQNGMERQQMTDELLADVHAAHGRADEAVKLGDKTLQEAQQTYNTLLEFNKMVQESKDQAKEAVEMIPEIRKQIAESEQKTREAAVAFNGAEVNAQIAKEAAQDAEKKYAQKASEGAYKIRKSAEATLAAQANLVTKVNEVKTQVSTTSEEVDDLAEKADADHKTIFEAKAKVGQAKTNAAEVKKQVDKAIEDISSIVKELNNLPDIDDASLSKLSEKLVTAEKQFVESKIDEELSKLRTARHQQVERVKKYQDELDRLRKDVVNLEDIRTALPSQILNALDNNHYDVEVIISPIAMASLQTQFMVGSAQQIGFLYGETLFTDDGYCCDGRSFSSTYYITSIMPVFDAVTFQSDVLKCDNKTVSDSIRKYCRKGNEKEPILGWYTRGKPNTLLKGKEFNIHTKLSRQMHLMSQEAAVTTNIQSYLESHCFFVAVVSCNKTRLTQEFSVSFQTFDAHNNLKTYDVQIGVVDHAFRSRHQTDCCLIDTKKILNTIHAEIESNEIRKKFYDYTTKAFTYPEPECYNVHGQFVDCCFHTLFAALRRTCTNSRPRNIELESQCFDYSGIDVEARLHQTVLNAIDNVERNINVFELLRLFYPADKEVVSSTTKLPNQQKPITSRERRANTSGSELPSSDGCETSENFGLRKRKRKRKRKKLSVAVKCDIEATYITKNLTESSSEKGVVALNAPSFALPTPLNPDEVNPAPEKCADIPDVKDDTGSTSLQMTSELVGDFTDLKIPSLDEILNDLDFISANDDNDDDDDGSANRRRQIVNADSAFVSASIDQVKQLISSATLDDRNASTPVHISRVTIPSSGCRGRDLNASDESFEKLDSSTNEQNFPRAVKLRQYSDDATTHDRRNDEDDTVKENSVSDYSLVAKPTDSQKPTTNVLKNEKTLKCERSVSADALKMGQKPKSAIVVGKNIEKLYERSSKSSAQNSSDPKQSIPTVIINNSSAAAVEIGRQLSTDGNVEVKPVSVRAQCSSTSSEHVKTHRIQSSRVDWFVKNAGHQIERMLQSLAIDKLANPASSCGQTVYRDETIYLPDSKPEDDNAVSAVAETEALPPIGEIFSSLSSRKPYPSTRHSAARKPCLSTGHSAAFDPQAQKYGNDSFSSALPTLSGGRSSSSSSSSTSKSSLIDKSSARCPHVHIIVNGRKHVPTTSTSTLTDQLWRYGSRSVPDKLLSSLTSLRHLRKACEVANETRHNPVGCVQNESVKSWFSKSQFFRSIFPATQTRRNSVESNRTPQPTNFSSPTCGKLLFSKKASYRPSSFRQSSSLASVPEIRRSVVVQYERVPPGNRSSTTDNPYDALIPLCLLGETFTTCGLNTEEQFGPLSTLSSSSESEGNSDTESTSSSGSDTTYSYNVTKSLVQLSRVTDINPFANGANGLATKSAA